MPSQTPFRIELLDEQPDNMPPPQHPDHLSLREVQLKQAEARILSIAGQQQKTALYIQTLLTLLGARSLLLLGLASATALIWQTLTDPAATLEKMILAAAASALLVLPLVWLIAKKG